MNIRKLFTFVLGLGLLPASLVFAGGGIISPDGKVIGVDCGVVASGFAFDSYVDHVSTFSTSIDPSASSFHECQVAPTAYNQLTNYVNERVSYQVSPNSGPVSYFLIQARGQSPNLYLCQSRDIDVCVWQSFGNNSGQSFVITK